MTTFLQKFAGLVLGVLHGFDRVCFRGTLRNLAYAQGLQHYLWARRIPYKDFAAHSTEVTAQLIEASLAQAVALGRPTPYINTSAISLEEQAKQIAARDGIRQGLVCVFRRVEPALSFEVRKNRERGKLEIKYRERRCLHLYHYQIHPVFGFLHARIQTWFPFHTQVCLNGREWLARQLDAAGLGYQRRDNCFTWLEDLARTQALADQQLDAPWTQLLAELGATLNPLHAELFARYPTQYYWSVAQSEWASDVLFRSREDLETLYPRFVRHAITTFGPVDVLRFFGRRVTGAGRVPGSFRGEIDSNLKEHATGVRVKHWLNKNALKLYDKGSVLRSECTINNPEDFRVFRPKEGDPDGAKAWRPLRYGVADLHRRAEVSQAANERQLAALAAVQDSTPLRDWAEPLCRPAPEPRRARPAAPPAPTVATDTPLPPPPAPAADAAPPASEQTTATPRRPRRVRALNPLAADDAALLQAVNRPEFLINGLRNRDLQRLLLAGQPRDAQEKRRRCGIITRKLRLLRAHGLLHKVPKTHRYLVGDSGRKAITALLAARDANAELLTTLEA